MVSYVSHTTIDSGNAFELSEWWKPVLDYIDVPGDPNEPGHSQCMIQRPDGSHRILFIEVPDAKSVKNRVHLDLRAADTSRDEEVERITALGATVLADRRRPDGGGWVTFADPEGNEFCVVR